MQKEETIISIDQLQKMFSVVGSEVVGTKKKVLLPSAKVRRVGPLSMPHPGNPYAVVPPQRASSPVHDVLIVGGNTSPMPSAKREKTNVETTTRSEMTNLPLVHSASFFPRRHPLQARRGKSAQGIAPLRLSTKQCAFCPNKHSSSSLEQSSPSSAATILAQSQSAMLSRSATFTQPTSSNSAVNNVNQDRKTAPQVPNVVVRFDIGTLPMQPTVVFPPTLGNAKVNKPWNVMRSADTFSPSRMSTNNVSVRSIGTADLHRLRQSENSADIGNCLQVTTVSSHGGDESGEHVPISVTLKRNQTLPTPVS